MSEVRYIGSAATHDVMVEDGGLLPLNPRFDLVEHSPDGFAWGYGGSGPSQLALAILAHATGSDALAKAHYQCFKSATIARKAIDKDFIINQEDVLTWVSLHVQECRR